MKKFALLYMENNSNAVMMETYAPTFAEAVAFFNGLPNSFPKLNSAGYAPSQLLPKVSYVVAEFHEPTGSYIKEPEVRRDQSAVTRQEHWVEAYALAIDDYIKGCKREGTVGMSADCLFNCVRIPDGGPQGTNCRWVARQTFNELTARGYSNFINA